MQWTLHGGLSLCKCAGNRKRIMQLHREHKSGHTINKNLRKLVCVAVTTRRDHETEPESRTNERCFQHFFRSVIFSYSFFNRYFLSLRWAAAHTNTKLKFSRILDRLVAPLFANTEIVYFYYRIFYIPAAYNGVSFPAVFFLLFYGQTRLEYSLSHHCAYVKSEELNKIEHSNDFFSFLFRFILLFI